MVLLRLNPRDGICQRFSQFFQSFMPRFHIRFNLLCSVSELLASVEQIFNVATIVGFYFLDESVDGFDGVILLGSHVFGVTAKNTQLLRHIS